MTEIEDDVVIIDLRDRTGPDVDPTPDAERVIAWLQSPGGSLHDRLMKAAALTLLEEAMAKVEHAPTGK